jgi:chromosomal replication initiator protein
MILNVNNTPLIGAKIIGFDPEICIKNISKALNVQVSDIIGNKRQREIVTARMIAAATIRNNTQLTLKEIGSIFGKDHSSIIYHLRQYDSLLKQKDKYFIRKLSKI